MKDLLLRQIDFPFACTYCGEMAEGRDHTIPQSYHRLNTIISVDGVTVNPVVCVCVPCCKSCNSILGDSPEWILGRRVLELKRRMIDGRYGRLLGQVIWTDEELDELGPTLRSHVEVENNKALTARRRYAYYPPSDFVREVELQQIKSDLECMAEINRREQ